MSPVSVVLTTSTKWITWLDPSSIETYRIQLEAYHRYRELRLPTFLGGLTYLSLLFYFRELICIEYFHNYQRSLLIRV